MSGLITGFVGFMAETLEPNQVRAERMQNRNLYEILKVAGIALVAIGAVGVLFSVIKVKFITTLLSMALCVIGVDVAKIGSNGVALSENYTSMLNRMSSAASRRGITASPETLAAEALYQDTLVLGSCFRPLHEEL